MDKEDTLQELRDSLKTYEGLLRSQTEYIRELKHERDLLAAGYQAALERCAQLAAAATQETAAN